MLGGLTSTQDTVTGLWILSLVEFHATTVHPSHLNLKPATSPYQKKRGWDAGRGIGILKSR